MHKKAYLMKYKLIPLLLLLFSLLGCNSLPQIKNTTLQSLELNKPSQLKLQLDSELGDIQLAIRPNHITTEYQQALPQVPRAFLLLDNGQQLIVQGNVLRLQHEKQLISELKFPTTLSKITHREAYFLVADDAGVLYQVHINNQQLELNKQWKLSHSIDYLTANFAASYQGELSLFDEDNTLIYKINIPFNALDCVQKYCYLATDSGVQVVELADSGRTLQHALFSVAGAVSDLKVVQQTLYLAGEMGLTIVDASTPTQLQWLASNNKFGSAQQVRVGEFFTLLRSQSGHYHVVDTGMPKQPIWQSSFIGPKEGAFAIQQMSAWLVDDFELQRLNIADATLPILNHSGINLGGSRRVQLRDNTLYVADWFSGLHLYDISNPATPRHSGNVHTPGSSKGVWLDGDYIYVGDDDHGLQVVNLNNLQVIHEVATRGLAYTMDRVGDLLYLADHRGGFHLIDISNPEKAQIVGGHDTPNKVWSIQAYKHYALVTDDQSGVLIFDVSDPTQPQQVAQYQPGGFAEDIVIRDDIAYVAFFDDGLHILDISNPLQPVQLAHLATPGNARGIYLQDDLLYLADWYAGLQIIDIQQPAKPHWLGGLDTQGAAWGVVVQGDYAYIMDWWGGIQTVDVSKPSQPRQLHSYHAQDRLADIALNKGYVYLAAGGGGLQVFDVNNSQGPIWTTAFALSGQSEQVIIADDTAYISHFPGGISVVDIRDPFYVKLIDYQPLPSAIKQLTLNNGQLLALDSTGQLTAWLAEPGTALRMIEIEPEINHIAALGDSDNWPLLINQQRGIELLNPKDLQMVGTLVGNFQQALLRDEVLYTLTDEQLFIAQLHNTHIQPVSRWRLKQKIHDIQLVGKILYLSGDDSVLALDVSEIEQPRLQHIYPRSNQAGAIAIGENALFAAGDLRLSTAPLLPDVELKASARQVTLTVEKGYELGSYDLLMRNAEGEQKRYQNVFEIKRAKGKRINFTMEDLQKVMQESMNKPGDI